MAMGRIGIDEYFMKIARVVAERSTCLPGHSQVGAVLVRDKYIISTGYNGAPRGFPHCETCYRDESDKGENMDLCPAVHAEQNAIIQSALQGASPDGGTLYCTHFPCVACLRMLINAGVKSIVYGEAYDMENEIKKLLIEKSGVEVQQFKAG